MKQRSLQSERMQGEGVSEGKGGEGHEGDSACFSAF